MTNCTAAHAVPRLPLGLPSAGCVCGPPFTSGWRATGRLAVLERQLNLSSILFNLSLI
jgi:hypothetical protein